MIDYLFISLSLFLFSLCLSASLSVSLSIPSLSLCLSLSASLTHFTGYVVPVNVINHFLDDVSRHGSYSGVCGLGVRLQPMENDRLRKHFHMVST